MEDKQISGQESLQLIQQMIQVAKEEHREKGDDFSCSGIRRVPCARLYATDRVQEKDAVTRTN